MNERAAAEAPGAVGAVAEEGRAGGRGPEAPKRRASEHSMEDVPRGGPRGVGGNFLQVLAWQPLPAQSGLAVYPLGRFKCPTEKPGSTLNEGWDMAGKGDLFFPSDCSNQLPRLENPS